jgi:Zn-dependent M28 family amino/carboxypeptidase
VDWVCWVGKNVTDNGANVAVVLEAIRILKTTKTKLGRTVRLGFWDGEEEGLLGSRAYLAQHANESPKISSSFTIDDGTGKIRGLYQAYPANTTTVVKWLNAFSGTLALRDQVSSDHVAFVEHGVPSFFAVQDPLDYEGVTWHTTKDDLNAARPENLRHNAAILAWLIAQAANTEEILPRPTKK